MSRPAFALFLCLTSVLLLPLVASGEELPSNARAAFFATVSRFCGSIFEGIMSYPDDPEHAFHGKRLEAEIAICAESEIRIPFTVGTDRSRTWILSLGEHGLLLKHDHRHADGTPDEITMYGGWAGVGGSAVSQSFPADEETAGMIPEAATNVWTLSLAADGSSLTYSLKRHGEPRFEATLRRR